MQLTCRNLSIKFIPITESGCVGIDIEKLYLISKVFGVPINTLVELIVEVYQNGCDKGLDNSVKQLKNLPLFQLDDEVELI